MPEDYDDKDFINVKKIFESLKDEKYSLNNISSILDEIDEIASLRLYDFINIDVKEEIVDENKINYKFIVKDSEKFYVEKINVFGNLIP